MVDQPPRLHAGPRQLAKSSLRIFGAITSLLLVYFMFPLTDRDNVLIGLVAVGIGLTVFFYIFTRQLRKIRSADYPILRAVEAIALVGTFFIILMATVAVGFASADPSSYSEAMSRLDALYFTVTTLATVGFGDITPTDDITRAFTTVQIILGVSLLGAGVRVLLGVAQRVAEGRGHEPSAPDPSTAD